MKVRTRFAPSPTGMLHVGALRTALFSWLIAKQAGGEFLLRIEDTDMKREVEGAVEQIKQSLQWLSINWSEEPLYQSKRLDVYKKYARQLLNNGRAYADTHTPEELERLREQSKQTNKPFLFRNLRPKDPPSWDETQPLRFKVEKIKSCQWHDEVRGNLSAGEEALDDFILIKSDGFPTYNFAHVVDDYEMGITHVVRGEEFISSTPKFLSLYEALGWEKPKFITLPPVLGKTGGKKLSKRDGAMSVLEYRKRGYLPEAMINFLVTLGWNDGTQQEVFTLREIIKKFSVDRIQKGGARFDNDRLDWLSGQHMRRLSTEELYARITENEQQGRTQFWPAAANNHDNAYKLKTLKLVHERLKHFDELPGLTQFFFVEPTPVRFDTFNKKALGQNIDSETVKRWLETAHTALENNSFAESDLEDVLQPLIAQLETTPRTFFMLLRLTITGQTVSPGLFETMHVLGREATLKRIQAQIDILSQ